jgi:Ser/Thr protein kinase RdoA (MazF antagonist)
MREFAALTETGRMRRMSQVARSALAAYDLPDVSVRLVSKSYNTLYRIRSSDGPALLLRVGSWLRLHPPDTAEMEAAWLRALRAGTDLPVARHIPTVGGSTVCTVERDGVPQPRTCALFTWVPGHPLGRDAGSQQVRASGRLLAILHQHASRWTPPDGLNVPMANRVSYFEHAGDLEYPDPHKTVFQESRQRAQEAIDLVWQTDSSPPHLLHGDFTGQNIIENRTGLVPIDFQDLAWGHEVQDVAISLLPLARSDQSGALSLAFRNGYEEVHTWPDYDPGTFDALFAARRVQMADVSLGLQQPGFTEYLDRSAVVLADWMGAS